MKKNKILYLSKLDVKNINLSIKKIIEILEKSFYDLSFNKIEMPPKPGIHPEDKDNFIHAMPVYIPHNKIAGLKWVSGYPNNLKKGLNYINGLMILNNPSTGLPLSIMDCRWITAVRTGVATAISAKYLANKNSSRIGIIGCGVQGHSNLEAICKLFPIKKVFAFDILEEQSNKLVFFAREKLNVMAKSVSSVNMAVEECDIIVTSGPILKNPHGSIRPEWISLGTFISCVDFDSYMSRDALKKIDKWVTDDKKQYDYYKRIGYFQQCPEVYAELSDLVSSKKLGRESSQEITCSVNLGIAMEDVLVASLLYKKALETKIGSWLEL